MLQPLLADRFHLKVHSETKEFPVYNLVIAKGGPKLQQTKPEDMYQGVSGASCFFLRSRMGYIQVQGCTPKSHLGADLLRFATGRTVIDKTGLTARIRLRLLRWADPRTTASRLRRPPPTHPSSPLFRNNSASNSSPPLRPSTSLSLIPPIGPLKTRAEAVDDCSRVLRAATAGFTHLRRGFCRYEGVWEWAGAVRAFARVRALATLKQSRRWVTPNLGHPPS